MVFARPPVLFLDQAHNVFVVDGGGESSHIPPTPSSEFPYAIRRRLECGFTALVVAADRGFSYFCRG